MRIAYLSPLPPERSGIADYTFELLPELARRCEIELVVAGGARPEVASLGLPMVSADDLAARQAAAPYDALLYQIGNDGRYHGWIYDLALRHPGVVVLHEVVLHHLVRHRTLGAGRPAAYVEALRYAYGASGELAGRRAVESGVPVDPCAFPLFEELIDRSRAAIVHNSWCRDRIHRSRAGAPVSVVPHHLSLATSDGGPAPERSTARAELGIAEGELLVASCGFVTPAKRVDVLLLAFRELRAAVPGARLALVGEVEPRYDLRSLPAADEPGVAWIGRADHDRFLQWMAACDIAVNLRWPTGGETSGTFVRLLGMGKPVVASRVGAFADTPPGCCALVDVGGDEVAVLAALLRALAEQPALRREMGENARRLATGWTLESSAEGYAAALRQCVGEGRRPRPAVPPLAPFSGDDVGTEVLAQVAAAAADLGVDEADEELLRAVAEPFLELDLDRGWERR